MEPPKRHSNKLPPNGAPHASHTRPRHSNNCPIQNKNNQRNRRSTKPQAAEAPTTPAGNKRTESHTRRGGETPHPNPHAAPENQPPQNPTDTNTRRAAPPTHRENMNWQGT